MPIHSKLLCLLLCLMVVGCSGGSDDPIFADSPDLNQSTGPDESTMAPVPSSVGDERIFFSADLASDGVDQVYSVKPDGSDLKLLTSERPGIEPDLSPDGTKIAYSISDIRIMNAGDGSGDTILTFPDIAGGSFDTYPAFSPDGLEIAFVRFAPLSPPNIYKVRIADKLETFIVAAGGAINWQAFGLAWSPNGTQLLWGAWDPLGIGTFSAIKLFGAPADGSSAGAYLVDGSHPAYRPDGGALTYVTSIGDVAIAEPNGVFGTRIGRGDEPSFSPDGTRIVYQAENRAELTVYNSADASLTPILNMNGKNVRGMDWGIVR